LTKLYGNPKQNQKSRSISYKTSSQAYSNNDVSEALKLALESRQKAYESKRSHFSFGFLSKSPPKTAAALIQRVPMRFLQAKKMKCGMSSIFYHS